MPRVTVPMLRILALFLQEPQGDWYCRSIARRLGLGSGTVTEVLYRLEALGWVTSWWEDEAAVGKLGRRPRRLYHLNSTGIAAAKWLLQQNFPGATFPEGAPA